MKSSLADKLRQAYHNDLTDVPLLLDAADEIERLREALQRIADAPAWGAPDRWETTPAEVRQLARAALEAKP